MSPTKRPCRMIYLLFLLAFSFFSCQAILPEVIAVESRSAKVTCENDCAQPSSSNCTETAWHAAAALSREMTGNCSVVIYTAALGDQVDMVLPIREYWRPGQLCSVLFLSKHSKLAKNQKIETSDRIENWSVVLVENLLDAFTNYRRAVKVVKLSPHFLFHSNVQYALWVDTKLQLLHHPSKIIPKLLDIQHPVIMTAVQHPKIRSVAAEVESISKDIVHRPTITENFTLLVKQLNYYSQSGILHNHSELFIESAFLIHAVQPLAARLFRCAWLQQIEAWSDRDQVAFPFVAGYYSNGEVIEQDTGFWWALQMPSLTNSTSSHSNSSKDANHLNESSESTQNRRTEANKGQEKEKIGGEKVYLNILSHEKYYWYHYSRPTSLAHKKRMKWHG